MYVMTAYRGKESHVIEPTYFTKRTGIAYNVCERDDGDKTENRIIHSAKKKSSRSAIGKHQRNIDSQAQFTVCGHRIHTVHVIRHRILLNIRLI